MVNADDAEGRAHAARRATRDFLQPAGSEGRFHAADPAVGAGPWLARRGAALLPLSALRISGPHNAANALATLALGDALRLPIAPMLDELREFPGCRIARSGSRDIGGVRYINDSKGTNVGATLAAVGGLAGPLVLIAGGDGKGQDFTPLAQAFRGKVRTAVLLGPRRRAHRNRAGRHLPHRARGSMEEAVRPRRVSRNPATPCCCRRPVRASTCFATMPNAATRSPPR